MINNNLIDNKNQCIIKKMTKYKVKPLHKTTQFSEYLIYCKCIALCLNWVSLYVGPDI